MGMFSALSHYRGDGRNPTPQPVLEKARKVFLEHIRLASQPAAGQSEQQKEFKAQYNRGGASWNMNSGRSCGTNRSAILSRETPGSW